MLENNFFMPETLAVYVTRILLEKNLSGYDVERLSHRGISQTHVNRIQNAEVLNPSTNKLKALAKGLSVPEHELFAVARGLAPAAAGLSHERLASIDEMYSRMSKTQKKKCDYVIELLEREAVRILREKSENDISPAQTRRVATVGTMTDGQIEKARKTGT